MNTKILPAVLLSAPVLLGIGAAPAYAALPCKDNIAQVEAAWNATENNYLGHPDRMANQIQMAREACAAHKEAEATKHLDVVRTHLRMPLVNPVNGKQ